MNDADCQSFCKDFQGFRGLPGAMFSGGPAVQEAAGGTPGRSRLRAAAGEGPASGTGNHFTPEQTTLYCFHSPGRDYNG